MEKKGPWIVLEGPDGTGTTTIAKLLAGRIFEADKEHLVLLTREPTKRKHGRRIREMLSNPSMDINATGKTLCELFVLDRYDHMDNIVHPAIMEGLVVVQDRGMYSTVAYQGVQGIPHEDIIEMHKDMIHVPDAVIIFDVTMQEALRRLGKRTEAKEAFDQDSFQGRIHAAYRTLPDLMHRLAPQHPIRAIDANESIESVLEQCWQIVDPLLPYKRN